MITSEGRINRISETDLEIWAEALARAIGAFAKKSRPVMPPSPTNEDAARYFARVQLDEFVRSEARKIAGSIPAILQKFVYMIIGDPKFYVRSPDDPNAPSAQVAEDKDWILYSENYLSDPPTAASPRQTLEDATIVLGSLFNIMVSPPRTITPQLQGERTAPYTGYIPLQES